MESEGGDGATETPPRERTAEVDRVKPLQAKSSRSKSCLPAFTYRKTHQESGPFLEKMTQKACHPSVVTSGREILDV